jgi:nitrogen fixation protein NifQ
MSAEETYDWLAASSARGSYDAFDIHVVASALAMAIDESRNSETLLTEGLGLERPALARLIAEMFPAALHTLEHKGLCNGLIVDQEEQSVREILEIYATGASGLERLLAAIIARRCKWPHHLWQDLGLRNRGELSELMKRHFAPLSEKNLHNMKWKKFLYRMVCGSEGFRLCTSPVCSECDDFADCFGAEEGDARLAYTPGPGAKAA